MEATKAQVQVEATKAQSQVEVQGKAQVEV
jgi:hypothetical protein